MEIFKNTKIKGYQVSNLGNVKSLKTNRILKSSVSKGYKYVCVYDEKKPKTFTVHQLVGVAFLNHKPNGHKIVIDHINGDKLDNRVENLRLVTQRDNCYTHHNGTSKYKGVSWRKNRKSWVAQIYIDGKAKYIGSSKDEKVASKMYINELKKLENVA